VTRRVLAIAAAAAGAAGVLFAQAVTDGVVAFLVPPFAAVLGVVAAVVASTVRGDRRLNALLGEAWEQRQATERAARQRELRRQALARAQRRVREGADR